MTTDSCHFSVHVEQSTSRVATMDKVIDYRSGTDSEAEGYRFIRDKA